MRLVFLGAGVLNGKERTPMPLSFALEKGEDIYLFDAVEGCVTAAQAVGLNLSNVRAVFITDKQIARASGLGNLLLAIYTARQDSETSGENPPVSVYIDSRELFEAVMKMLDAINGETWDANSTFMYHSIRGGDPYIGDYLNVTFIDGGTNSDGCGKGSYSLRISNSLFTLLYLPDTDDIDRLANFLCDAKLLIMESKEDRVEAVCGAVKELGHKIGHTFIINNGCSSYSDPASALMKASNILGKKVYLAEAGTCLYLIAGNSGRCAKLVFDEGLDIITRKALRALQKNRGHMSVCEVARLCGVSTATLERHFHSVMGVGFASYSLIYRLEGASEDILKNNEPLKCIARKWGFSNASHLCNKFAGHFGCTTSEYKKRLSSSPKVEDH